MNEAVYRLRLHMGCGEPLRSQMLLGAAPCRIESDAPGARKSARDDKSANTCRGGRKRT